MGIDWRTASLSVYFETIEAFCEARDPKAKKEPVAASDSLKAFMREHGAGD